MADHQKLSRRRFLRLSAVSVASILTACGGPVTPTAVPTTNGATAVPPTTGAATAAPATAVPAAQFKEAPMLAALVQAGKLPPVDERLPKTPLVVPVTEQIGTYGG